MNVPQNPPVFATLGCRLNAYETEAMKELAAAAGLSQAVIVNTCAVTGEAVRKAKQEIRRLSRENPGAAIIVTESRKMKGMNTAGCGTPPCIEQRAIDAIVIIIMSPSR